MNEWSIECRRLSKCYGHTTALRELTFGLPRGKVIGLLGPNGSGKTTLMKILGGVLRQSGCSLPLIFCLHYAWCEAFSVKNQPVHAVCCYRRRLADAAGMAGAFYKRVLFPVVFLLDTRHCFRCIDLMFFEKDD